MGRMPTMFGIYAVWAVSGVLTLFGALVCAELASNAARILGLS